MNAKIKGFSLMFVFSLILFAAMSLLSGCAGKPSVVIVDGGDIERLRLEYEQLRSEYNRLQQDHQQLIADQQFYADYYRNATAAIESGIRELGELGSDSLTEIARIRANLTILKNIIYNIITGEQGEGRQDIKADGD